MERVCTITCHKNVHLVEKSEILPEKQYRPGAPDEFVIYLIIHTLFIKFFSIFCGTSYGKTKTVVDSL